MFFFLQMLVVDALVTCRFICKHEGSFSLCVRNVREGLEHYVYDEVDNGLSFSLC